MGRAAEEFKQRIWFTLSALVIYRLGTYCPIPGIDPQLLAQVFDQQSGGVLDLYDMFTGGALGRMSMLALGVVPYITAGVIMRLMVGLSPQLKALDRQGEDGHKKIYQYMRYGTVLLCLFQSYGIALGLESTGGGVVIEPGLFFQLTTVVTLTAGTVFVMWLGEQITQLGVGNGVSLIIFSGIVANLPAAVAGTVEQGRTGALPNGFTLVLAVMAVVLVVFIVFMERAQRRTAVEYPERQIGNKTYGGEPSYLPLKFNTPGIIPPLFAASLLLMGLAVPGFPGADAPAWLTALFGRGQPLYLAIYAALIVGFAFFYARNQFDPMTTADNLERHGGAIPGIRPGRDTGEYLSYVMTRLTTVGAAYLILVCVLPEVLLAKYEVPFYFGGLSLLILVIVTMDTVGQIHMHLLAHGLIKKGRRKGPWE